MQVAVDVWDAAEELRGEVPTVGISLKCLLAETSVAKWRHVSITKQKAVIS